MPYTDQAAVVEGGGQAAPVGEDELARLEEELRRREAEQMARLDALGQALFAKRKEAIEFRTTSGIEDEWQRAQEAYEGFDEANVPERGVHTNWRSKPPGQATIKKGRPRSTVFLNITRPYVEAAAGRVSDMLFPTDDRPWGLRSPAVPALIEARDSQAAVMLPNGQQATEADLAKAIMERADKKAKAAEKRIEDWLNECQWHASARRQVLDASRLGSGILKGPVPRKTRKIAVDSSNGETVIQVHEKISPATVLVSCWNLFPDPACGEDIHAGSFIWERDDISPKKLKELKGLPGYIDSQIEAVLEEGPQLPTAENEQFIRYAPNDPKLRKQFDIWHYTGTLEREDLEAAGCECEGETEQISATVTMVNNRVVKAALNPLDSGEFPYDVLCWQPREGFWAGIGVGHQISVPQQGVNAATRALMDNAGASAGVQIVLLGGVVEPVDGSWTLYANKVWRAKADADVQDVQKAFTAIEIPSRQVELMAIIQFYLKMAEDITGLPMLLQGQQGKAPDTVGGMTMLQNNASAVLRRMARLFDDTVTEHHIGRYYDWLLQYGENQEEKGAFIIDTRASSVLVERDLQNQVLVQMAPMVSNPQFRLDPNKYAQELLKSQKLDPKRFQFDDEEWERIQAQLAQQPDDPRVLVAQIAAEAEDRIKQVEMSWKAQQNERDRALKAGVAELMAEIEIAKQQGTRMISIDSVRAKLADTTIKVRAQERISDKTNVARQVSKPPTEPSGRAPRGQAYQR